MSQDGIDEEIDETVREFYQEQEDNRDPEGEYEAHQRNDPDMTTVEDHGEDLGDDHQQPQDHDRPDGAEGQDEDDEVFTQDEVHTQGGKRQTNKKIGALKTNFGKFIKKLMAGQLSDLKDPLVDTSDAVLLATRQMLDKSWYEFQHKMSHELTQLGITPQEVNDAIYEVRRRKYGQLYANASHAIEESLMMRQVRNDAQKKQEEEQKPEPEVRRRSIIPPTEFHGSSSSSEDSRGSQSLREQQQAEQWRDQNPQLFNLPDDSADSQSARNQQNAQENRGPGLSPEEKRRNAQWMMQNRQLNGGLEEDDRAVRQARLEKAWAEENRMFDHLVPGQEQAVPRVEVQAPTQAQAQPTSTTQAAESSIPTQEEVKATVEQLKQAGEPEAAKQFQKEEEKRIRGMKAPTIQLYNVPPEIVPNFEAYIWTQGEEMNWPEPYIENCIAQFRKDRVFPGAIQLHGRFRKCQYPPETRVDTVNSPNVQLDPRTIALNQRMQEQNRLDEMAREAAQVHRNPEVQQNLHGTPDAKTSPSKDTGAVQKQKGNQGPAQKETPDKKKKKTKPDRRANLNETQGNYGPQKTQKTSNLHPSAGLAGQGPLQQRQNPAMMDPFRYPEYSNSPLPGAHFQNPADDHVRNLINQTSSPVKNRGTLEQGVYSKRDNLPRNSTVMPGSSGAPFVPDVASPARIDTTRPPPNADLYVKKSDFDEAVKKILSHFGSQSAGAPSGDGNPASRPQPQSQAPQSGAAGPQVPETGTTGPQTQQNFAFGQSQDARRQTGAQDDLRQNRPQGNSWQQSYSQGQQNFGAGGNQPYGANRNPYGGGGGPPGGGNPPGGGGGPPGGHNPPGGGGGNPPGGGGNNPPGGGGGGHGPHGGGGNGSGSSNDSTSHDAFQGYSRDRSVFQGTMGQGPIGNHSYRNPQGDVNDATQRGWLNRDGPGNSKMPLQPAPKFDGTGCFEAFVNNFHTYVGNKIAPEADKFGHLMQCLSGTPKLMLGALCSVPYEIGFLEEAFIILRKRYGGGNKLDRYITQRLAKVPQIKKFDLDSLVILSTTIDEIFYRVRSSRPTDYDLYFENQTWLVSQLMEKIPVWEQQAYVAEITRGPLKEQTFLTFRDFIMWRYEQANMLATYTPIDIPREAARPRAVAHGYQQVPCCNGDCTDPRVDYEPEDQYFQNNSQQAPDGASWQDPHQMYQGFVSVNDNAGQNQGAPRPAQQSNGQPSQGQGVTNPSPNGQPRRQPSCSCCGETDHWIWACRKFSEMKLGERYEFVRLNGLCYHCLGKGHGIAACNFRKDLKCGIDGCQARHHRLVHRPRNSNLCMIEEYVFYVQPANQVTPEAVIEHSCGVSVYCGQNFNINDQTINNPEDLEKYEHVSIKTITCDLVTGTKRKRVVVAVDSGANNTNIDTRLAEEMGLPVIRAGIHRRMHLVTRAENVVSNLVMFQLAPLGGEYGPHFTIGAFTVPGLIEGTPVPDWHSAAAKYKYLLETEPSAPEDDDKVSILLGTDYSHLMVGMTTLRGQMGEPIAEKTQLGWAIQGRTGKYGYRERAGMMIEQQSLASVHSLMTGDDNEADQPPEEDPVQYGDGGIRAPEEENESPNGWITNLEIENDQRADQEPRSDGLDTSYRESIVYSDPDSSLSSNVSELSEAEEQIVPQTETTFRNDHDEPPRLIRTRSQPVLSLDELDRLHELRHSTESLIRTRDFDWSESANTELARQVQGLETLEFGSIQRQKRRIHFQDEPMVYSDISSSEEDVEEGSEKTESIQVDPTPEESDTERGLENSAQGTLSMARDDLDARYQRFLTSETDQGSFDLEARQAQELWVQEHANRELTNSEENLLRTRELLMIPWFPEDEPDFLDSEDLQREMICSLREQIQEDTLYIGQHFLGNSHNFTIQEELRSSLAEHEGNLVFASCCGDEIENAQKRIEQNQELERLIKLHWEMEAVGLAEVKPRTASNSEPTPEQWTPAQKAIDDRMKVVYLPEEKKFQMTIPWKAGDKPNFRCNRIQVKRRQEDTLNKLPPERLEKVRAIFQNYLEKDYVRKLEPQEIFDEDTRYLPFFCVCDETKDTTPVRVVWDCRAVYHGKSLNSEIEDTPNRLQDLFRVLLRLRRYQYTITSDVSEMFLRVRLDPKDRPYHRFVFDGDDYIWNSILFGNVASPNGSQKVLSSVCDMFGKEFPEAEETLRHSLYMDDASDSRPTEEKALATAQQLIQLLDKCTMPIHKFYTNSTLVIQNLDPKLLAKQITIGEGSIEVETGKILGMCYNASPEEDYLSFTGKFKSIREWSNKASVTKVEKGKWTKRQVARAAASIYDPHGLISPFTVRSKIILQEIWKHKEIDWDDVLPEDICFSWEQWMEQVFVIPLIKIERWHRDEPKTSLQIHTFCDASEEGMCATVYLRVKKRKSVEVNLVAAKSRVSPLKAETISRLELAACVMGVRLSCAVQELYNLKTEEIFYWTDSMVSLHWINRPAKAFKAFVANRIGEIQTHTEPRQWAHVPTKDNPADIGTRQISAIELKDSELWWKGPSFLRKPQAEWPKKDIMQVVEEKNLLEAKELKATTFAAPEAEPKKENKEEASDKESEDFGRPVATSSPLETSETEAKKKGQKTRGLNLIDPHRQSVGLRWDGLRKITRRMAYVIRFIRALRKGPRLPTLELTNEEIQVATRRLIKMSQMESFQKEKRLMEIMRARGQEPDLTLCQNAKGSSIIKFAPFLDEHDIIRSRSRLNKEEIYGFDKTYPVILSRRSGLAKLIAEQTHFEVGHPVGHNALKARIAARFVIVGLGTLVTSIKWRCIICQIRQNKPNQQLQAALPVARLGKRMRPFADTGIDYAGPFELKMGRGKPRKKVWVLVLTCLATRAVHFEATGGMETTNVLNAISRFSDIRGTPETIVSDNQTSFIKADKDLQAWLKTVDFEYIRRATLNHRGHQGIEWVFNPPHAPHFGGVFEIIVKAMKRALIATIGHEDLDEEEFRTVVSKATWILNSRPIQRVGDSTDLETLTPSHFLGGIPEDAVFPPDLPNIRSELQERLKFQIRVQEHLWERFQQEIIPQLVSRQKWLYQKDNIVVGDLMVEIDEKTTRGHWKKVIITQIFPSKDSRVRTVEIRDGENRTYVRPITCLIPLKV